MKIEKVVIRPVNMPRKEGFAVRTGAYTTHPHVLVRVETDEGVIGHGEAAPIASYFGETQETIVEVLRHYIVPAVLGKDPMNIKARIKDMDLALPSNPCAKAAMDIALHDIKGRALGVPISSLLGGAQLAPLPLAYSVALTDPKKVVEKALVARDDGFTVIKLKGGNNVAEDVARLLSVRKALGHENWPWLRLDANGGYDNRTEIYRHIAELESLGLILLEQPYGASQWQAHRELRSRIRIPILLDESIKTGWDIEQVAQSPEGFVVNIKAQKSGGLFKASQMMAAAEIFGIPIQFGSQRESLIGNIANLHLASTVAPQDYCCDLRTAWGIREDLIDEVPAIKKGCVAVPDGPGLGVEVHWERSEAMALATFELRK